MSAPEAPAVPPLLRVTRRVPSHHFELSPSRHPLVAASRVQYARTVFPTDIPVFNGSRFMVHTYIPVRMGICVFAGSVLTSKPASAQAAFLTSNREPSAMSGHCRSRTPLAHMPETDAGDGHAPTAFCPRCAVPPLPPLPSSPLLSLHRSPLPPYGMSSSCLSPSRHSTDAL